jgi:hypothetical protein
MSQGLKTGCGLTSWDFEQGDTTWTKLAADDVALGDVSISTARAFSGMRSTRVELQITPVRSRLWLQEWLCNCFTGVMDSRGKTVTIQLYVEGAPAGAIHQCFLGGIADNLIFLPMTGGRNISVTSGVWTQIEYTFVEAQAQTLSFLILDCAMGGSDSPWTGAAYIDAATLE